MRAKRDILKRERFSLDEPAANGLRRGYTTGTCAAACVKAALLNLICHETVENVLVSLPDGANYLPIAIDRVTEENPGAARAEVIKDGGDDPDQTHRARIWARVQRNDKGRIQFLRGEGVGVVTQKGLQVPIGEPAINPVPRQMIEQAAVEVLAEGDAASASGFDIEIGCERGAEIAKRTFNPRLGIEGGISILGTTGIVEPKSLASFKASIEIYIRVALAENPEQMVLAPGNLGQRFSRTFLQLPLKQVVQMSNFVGFALEAMEQTLNENNHNLPRLWIVGHPGKLAKILEGIWDTHSQSASAVPVIVQEARKFGFPQVLQESIATCPSVEAIIELLREEERAARFWEMIESKIAEQILERLTRVNEVNVRLFEISGQELTKKK